MTQEMMNITTRDVLLAVERKHIFEPYREFYATKRFNFLTAIEHFPYIWDCFMQLDQILARELDLSQQASEHRLMLPMILFMNAHLKMRLVFELWASGYLAEANSLARDAVESAAHGHRLASAPDLQETWFKKGVSEATRKAFKEEFEQYKATHLFDGLPELHNFWKKFSDWGAHTNLESILATFNIKRTEKDLQYEMNYAGVNIGLLVRGFYVIILAFSSVERVVFNLCQSRLKLDFRLEKMRTRFEQQRESTRLRIIKDFNIPAPDLAQS